MEKKYTFEMFWEDLDNGYKMFYTYMNCKYLIYKLDKNCYKNELIEDIDIRHKNGEMVSRNEAIIKKTEIDINNLISDIKHFI